MNTTVNCPACGHTIEDCDGFGFVYCPACGHCTHPGGTGGICAICGRAMSESVLDEWFPRSAPTPAATARRETPAQFQDRLAAHRDEVLTGWWEQQTGERYKKRYP